jgi:hypothetical protein
VSLAETAQIYELLVKIDQILSGITVKSEKIQADAPKIVETGLNLRQEIRTLNIMMMITQKFTGSQELDGAIKKIRQFIMILMRLRMTMLAVEAATGPWGWLYAGANIAATAILISDASMSLGE